MQAVANVQRPLTLPADHEALLRWLAGTPDFGAIDVLVLPPLRRQIQVRMNLDEGSSAKLAQETLVPRYEERALELLRVVRALQDAGVYGRYASILAAGEVRTSTELATRLGHYIKTTAAMATLADRGPAVVQALASFMFGKFGPLP